MQTEPVHEEMPEEVKHAEEISWGEVPLEGTPEESIKEEEIKKGRERKRERQRRGTVQERC